MGTHINVVACYWVVCIVTVSTILFLLSMCEAFLVISFQYGFTPTPTRTPTSSDTNVDCVCPTISV